MAITPFWNSGEEITFGAGEKYIRDFNWSTVTALYTDTYLDQRNNVWGNPNNAGYVGVRQIGDGAKFHYHATYDGYVTFRALSGGDYGAMLTLYKPFLLPGLGNTPGLVDVYYGTKVSGLTCYVTAGEYYVLSVNSGAGYSADTVTLTAERTYGQPDNNSFSTPTFVTITTDGGVYDAEPVLNDFLTTGPDDPPGTYFGRTAWWTYASPHSGSVSYTISADPEADVSLRAIIWGYDGNNNMYQVGGLNSGSSWSETVPANTPRHIQIGSTGNQYYARGTFYHLTVTGQKTFAQVAPDNDLRSHAKTVSIPNVGDIYTSPSVLNTYATHDSSTGADDPTIEGLYRTVWYKYQPVTSGTYTVELLIDPDSTDVVLEEWRVNSSGVLYPSNTLVSSAEIRSFSSEVHHDVEPNTTRYYVIGTLTETTTGLNFRLRVDGPVTVAPPSDSEPPPLTPPSTPPWDPNAPNVPVVDPAVTKASLLTLIREFSGKILRAVRVIDAGVTPAHGSTPAAPWANISLVDPTAGNWLQSKTPTSLYCAAVDEAKMGNAKNLKVIHGPITQSAAATLITNDASVLISGWRIPDALPLPGVNGGSAVCQPVRSVRMTFTIDEFHCDVEFHPVY